MSITDEWKLLDVYFRDHMYPFTKHHLDSYRQFLKINIPDTIKSYNPISMVKLDSENEANFKVDVYVGGKDGGRIFIDRPTHLDDEGKQMLLSPQDARLLNLTYSTKIYADIVLEYTKEDGEEIHKTFPHTLIGSLPLMLHSDQCMLHGQGSKILRSFGECPMDPGGYFIVDGKEKVIISQERITTNRLFISTITDETDETAVRAYIRCTGGKGEAAIIPRTVELRLLRIGCYEANNSECYDEPVKQANIKTQGAIVVSLPSIAGTWPLTSVFRAFGIETDKEIIETICGPIEEAHPAFLAFLRPSLTHGASTGKFTMDAVHDQMRPFTYFKTIQQVKSVLALDVFPNIEGTIRDKGIYLGYLVSMMMKTALGVIPESDRDSYAFKRVDISGILLAQLFQTTYGQLRKHIRNVLDQEYNYGPWKNTGAVEDLIRKDNLHRIFPSNIITEIFTRSLKGMWGPPQEDPEQGKVQDLSRISYIGFLSHLRRVNLPLDRSIKVTSPHRLHSQQWGIMCPFESPDGASIGYLKNFALLTQITAGSDPAIIYQILEEFEVIPLRLLSHSTAAHQDTIRIFVNGSWYGITETPYTLVTLLRLYRRNGLINPFISISWNIRDKEIRIQTEAGRPCRPLLIVEKSEVLMSKAAAQTTPKTTWFDLLYGSLLPATERTEAKYYQDGYISPETFSNLQRKETADLIALLEKTQAQIEYLDIEEENTMYVAMTTAEINDFHTHLEIHPSTAFSVVTQIVPFSNHNQAPRIIFHAAQSKQALGIYNTNFTERFDTASYIQHYPQRRIIGTKGGHYNGSDRMPNGFNVIVAIQTFTGFNQEDSIMINKTAVERGLFRVTGYKTLTAMEKTLNANEKIVFANPITMRDSGKVVENIKHADYTLLNDEGIIKEESYIPIGQEAVVLGMVHVRDNVKEVQRGVLIEKQVVQEYHDISLKTDVHYYGTIDRVFIGHQIPGNPNRICKIRFRKPRRAEFGNKFCSSHGQKGVIGMIIPQEDMPFTKDGIVPDLIINPHAFPSRMTMGHVIETIFSKLCCLEGTRGDGTVFMPFDKEAIYDTLEERGFEKHGNEILYNGRTGEQIKTEIFIGPIYYYQLKHMVADKIHSRNIGPKVQLTRQPTSGRSAGGGLRIGEMERDSLLSHGLALFAKECMMEKSDKYRWGVCRHCGVLAKYAPRRDIFECLNCGLQDISVIETPYSFKLLIQEMEALGIQMRISDESFPDEEDQLLFQELYKIEPEQAKPKEPKTKTKTKTKSKSKKKDDESDEEEEEDDEDDDELSTIDEESDNESALSEMSGGEAVESDTDEKELKKIIENNEPELVIPQIAGLAEEDISISTPLPQIITTPLDTDDDDEPSALKKAEHADLEIKQLANKIETDSKINAQAAINQVGVPTEDTSTLAKSGLNPKAAFNGGSGNTTKVIMIKQGGQRLAEPKPEGGDEKDDDDDFFTE